MNYIINDDSLYLSENNYYAEVGSFVHEILAKIFNGELEPKKAYRYFTRNYKKYVSYSVKQSIMDNTYRQIAEYFKTLDLSWIDKYEILGVELEVNFTVGKNKFIGFIDLLLRDKVSGKIVVLDHKSSEYPLKQNGDIKKKSEQSFQSYKRQMYLYCHAIHQLYGEFPDKIIWNHFKNGGKLAIIPFDESEYKETLQWVSGVISTIKKEKEFEPKQDYFYCTNLCNFRNSCEYIETGCK